MAATRVPSPPPATHTTMSKTLEWADLLKHVTAEDCWIAIEGKVYDVTKFMADHPGGEEVLNEVAGARCLECPFGAHAPTPCAETGIGRGVHLLPMSWLAFGALGRRRPAVRCASAAGSRQQAAARPSVPALRDNTPPSLVSLGVRRQGRDGGLQGRGTL